MHTTSRLALEIPDAGDNESAYPPVSSQQMTTLDNAAIYTEGTLVSRPTPVSTEHGQFYKTTDSNKETLTWTDGSLWLPLGLIPQTTTSSIGVLSGQALITTGSSALTITLPSHAAGQICAIVNGLSSTVATTVSGSSIQGVGLSSASSFLLGTPGASATLIDDGTSWRFLAGQQDTGWVALTVLSGNGWSALAGTYAPAYRVQGDVGTLRGGLNGTGVGSSHFATLPTLARPTTAAYAVVGTSGTSSTLASVGTDGTLNAAPDGYDIYLAFSYQLS